MKELLTFSANFHATFGEGSSELRPGIEVIFVVTEPVYAVEPPAQITKSYRAEALRFACDPAAMRALADALRLDADKCERLFTELQKSPAQTQLPLAKPSS